MAIGALGLAAADTIALLSAAASTATTVYGMTQGAGGAPAAPAAAPKMAAAKAPIQQSPEGRQLELAKSKKGRSSTIKTSALGLPNASIGKKSLLGTG